MTTNTWTKAQKLELGWQVWYYAEHIPLKRRYEVAGYRYCEGRMQMQHCGIPHAGLAPQEITGALMDVGCGAISVWEQRPDLEVTAIDPLLQQMATHSKLKRYVRVGPKENVLYLSKTIGEVGLGGMMDWVWCYNVLDHAEDPVTIMTHCRRVLKPGGILMLGVDVRRPDYDWSGGDDERAMHPSQFSAEDALDFVRDIGGMTVEWQRPILKRPKFRFGLRARKN